MMMIPFQYEKVVVHKKFYWSQEWILYFDVIYIFYDSFSYIELYIHA